VRRDLSGEGRSEGPRASRERDLATHPRLSSPGLSRSRTPRTVGVFILTRLNLVGTNQEKAELPSAHFLCLLPSLSICTYPLLPSPGTWVVSSKDSPSSSSRGVLFGGGAGGERPEKVDTLLTRMAWRGGLGGPLLNTSVSGGGGGGGAGRTTPTPTTGSTLSRGPGGRVQDVGVVGGMIGGRGGCFTGGGTGSPSPAIFTNTCPSLLTRIILDVAGLGGSGAGPRLNTRTPGAPGSQANVRVGSAGLGGRPWEG
jgi:hypothetical protein